MSAGTVMAPTAFSWVLTASHLGLALLALAGFAGLALAMHRHGEQLLGTEPAERTRRRARAAGWLLLAVALALGMARLGGQVGTTLWLGWLSLAGLALVFALPKWSRAPRRRERAAPAAKPPGTAPAAPRLRRAVAALLLVATIATFAVALGRAEPHLLARSDAVRGTVGPWPFVLAEADRDAPEIVDMDVPIKAFRLRLCEACDAQVRTAYLKVHKPHQLRASGMAFEGARHERKTEIQLPSTTRAGSELWLTVVGKDGAVHQASVRMDRVAPATVAWFERQKADQ